MARPEAVAVDPEIYWDPYDIAIDTDPHPVWRRMRDEAPLYRNDRHDFWALSRYADVLAASREPLIYSSAKGTVLEIMGEGQLTRPGLIIFMDPPEHNSLRALVSKAFTPRRIAALEEQIRAICVDLLDPYVGSGGFDYVADFGAQLPSKVISALLGVPAADQPHVLQVINTTFHLDPDSGMVNDVSLGAQVELWEYLTDQLEQRRRTPSDDMLTALVEVELTDDGERRKLTAEEAVAFAGLLISAGTETVARLLGWTAIVLDQHPEQRAALVEDPSLVPNAVEELLRYEAPSPVQGRTLTQQVELYGTALPQGARVLLLTGSAGRDERAFPDPDRFDVRRKIDQHVSFGVGTHYCLGAALARLEGRVAIAETLARFPTWQVDHDRAVRLHTSTVRGYQHVPIAV
ncbi:MAG TPA: cytochrome P450 [Mycobacteriales bacterium]|nr:cytochrome P450 [Mycobacteriales bacterium]